MRLTIGVIGTIPAFGAEWIALDNGGSPSAALLDLAIGLTYLHGGLAIWGRAAANRTGVLMATVGLTWFIRPARGCADPGLEGVLAATLVDTKVGQSCSPWCWHTRRAGSRPALVGSGSPSSRSSPRSPMAST